MEISLNILSGLISALMSAILTYAILKKVQKDVVFQVKEQLFSLTELQNNEDFQKFVFSIGGLIGKGARTGIGMDKKLNPKDVVLNMVMDWWQNRPNARNPELQNRSQRPREENPLQI